MSRVITFSQFFPAHHPKKGKPTYFVEKCWRSIGIPEPTFLDYIDELNPDLINTYDFRSSLRHPTDFSPKHHTIRAGNRWKVGDYFSPRVWSGKPYQSRQIIIAPDLEIKKIWSFEIKNSEMFINNRKIGSLETVDLALNDGLHTRDLFDWFKYPKPFTGQIICWSENIEY